MTAALEGVSGQQHAPAAIYPRERPGTILQEAGWAPGSVWTGGKSRPHRDSIPDRPARSQSLYIYIYIKVKFSCYRPGVAQRVGRGIALLFHDRGTRRCGQQHAPAALYPRESPGTHFTGGWVGPRAGLDGRKISSSPGFDPGASSPVTQSLYRLSYRAHIKFHVGLEKNNYDEPQITKDWPHRMRFNHE